MDSVHSHCFSLSTTAFLQPHSAVKKYLPPSLLLIVLNMYYIGKKTNLHTLCVFLQLMQEPSVILPYLSLLLQSHKP